MKYPTVSIVTHIFHLNIESDNERKTFKFIVYHYICCTLQIIAANKLHLEIIYIKREQYGGKYFTLHKPTGIASIFTHSSTRVHIDLITDKRLSVIPIYENFNHKYPRKRVKGLLVVPRTARKQHF